MQDISKKISKKTCHFKKLNYLCIVKKKRMKKLILNEDHIKMLQYIAIEDIDDDYVGVLKEAPFYSKTTVLEDMSMYLGIRDNSIEGTENDAEGRAFSEKDTDYMLGIYDYLVENIHDIETLIHQFVGKGGITPGTYISSNYSDIWKKESDIVNS